MNDNNKYTTLKTHIDSIDNLIEHFPSHLWEISDMKYCVLTLRNYLQECYAKKNRDVIDEYVLNLDLQFVAEISHKISVFLSSYSSKQYPNSDLTAVASELTGQIKQFLYKMGLISKAELKIEELNVSTLQQLNKINKQQKNLSENIEKIQKLSIEQETKAKSFEESFDDSKQTIVRFRDEVNNLRAKIEAEREEYAQLRKKEFAKMHEDFERDIESIVATSEGIYQELNRKNIKADSIIGTLSEKAIVSEFGAIAESERRVGHNLRIAAFVLMGVTILIAVVMFIVYSCSNAQYGISGLVLRTLTLLVLLVPAWYCASESGKHFTISHRNKRFQLELAALRPYLKE
ncbi:MAG: hypothetical protein PHN98_11725, partial [Smithellaceae bacterium]|nr:hypothetical protein [Smithellaceae bacterium]